MKATIHHVLPFAHWVNSLDAETLAISILLLISLIVLGRIINFLSIRRDESGLQTNSTAVSVDGSEAMPVRNYVSEIQGIAGRPDAIIKEDGFLIPVERKPLARKLRDRYVAQLLVYMRLIEEFEGKKPPYGYLILGPSCRKVRIDNTPERQAWLQGLLDEMRAVLEGKPAVPTPQEKKCSRCDMREYCSHRADIKDKPSSGGIGNSHNSDLVQAPTARLKATARQ